MASRPAPRAVAHRCLADVPPLTGDGSRRPIPPEIMSLAAPPARRALAGFLTQPVLVGAAWCVLLAALDLAQVYGDDRVQGVEVKSLRGIIATTYRDEVLRVAGLCLAIAVLVGAALGGVAGGVLVLRERLLGVAPRDRRRALGSVLGLVIALHGASWARDVAARPQLHAHGLYDLGGWRAAVQVALTSLGPGPVLALSALLVGTWFLAPLRDRAAREQARDTLATWGRARGARVLALATGLAALALLVTRAPRAVASSADREHPNVLVVAVDSLRDDRVVPRTAPFLAAYAARGTRFDRAYVSLPRTFPSWVTILSGRHPHHHGVRTMFPSWEGRRRGFDAVPERFARDGRATFVVGDFAADIFSRVQLGFAEIDTPVFNFRELLRVRVLSAQTSLLPFLATARARRVVPSLDEMHEATDPALVTARALSALERHGSRPFFGTVFYSTAHFPYAAPHPYYARFADPAYRGRFRYEKANLLGLDSEPDEADVRQARALYDGAVSATDDAIAGLVRGLEARGLAERTVVVVTADHGESLWESGRGQGHGDHLFGDESLHVPLVIVDPRRTGGQRVKGIARDVDLAPTLYALGGVAPPGDLDGRSLVPALDGAPLPPALAFAETGLWFTRRIPALAPDERLPYGDLTELLQIDPEHADDLALRPELAAATVAAKHRMVRDDRYKLVYLPTRSGARFRLYDTETDPNETHDVAGELPEVRARLERELWSWMLEDRNLERRAGLLVPRADTWRGERGQAQGVRVQP